METVWKIAFLLLLFILVPRWLWSRHTRTKIALLTYSGGGDGYAGSPLLSALIRFCNANLHTGLSKEPAAVEADSPEIFNYPYIRLTVRGGLVFTPAEVQNLRDYLLAGGFLHANGHSGLVPDFRREMNKILPEDKLTGLPWDHPIFHARYPFPQGSPQTRAHGKKRPPAFGIIRAGRICVLFTCGTGREDPKVPHVPEAQSLEALKTGANIISYAIEN